jgi:hypothetical protein
MKEKPIRRMLNHLRPGVPSALFCTAAMGLALLAAPAAQGQPSGPGVSGAPPAGGAPPPAVGAQPWDIPENADLKPPPPKELHPGLSGKRLLAQLVPPLPAGLPDPSPDPHNLEGAWVHDQMLGFEFQHDMYDNPPPYTARGHKLLARRVKAQGIGKPYSNAAALCRPPGVLWQQEINYPFVLLQSKDRLELLFQDYHGRETIYLDPAKAPPADHKSYMGVSVGHWVGDTLVVVTKGMKIPTLLDAVGTPASADAIITQRIRKVHQGHWFLEIVTTIDDPVYYTHPWSLMQTFAWRPDMEVLEEYDCETQIGDKSVPADAGLVPEPPEDAQ